MTGNGFVMDPTCRDHHFFFLLPSFFCVPSTDLPIDRWGGASPFVCVSHHRHSRHSTSHLPTYLSFIRRRMDASKRWTDGPHTPLRLYRPIHWVCIKGSSEDSEAHFMMTDDDRWRENKDTSRIIWFLFWNRESDIFISYDARHREAAAKFYCPRIYI